MSLMTLLERAQAGRLFTTVARSLDLDEAQTHRAMVKLCPAIAERLQAKAAADDELFQSLLDLIEDGAQASPLDDQDGLTSPEAIADGNTILADIYGSRNAAMVALRVVDEAIPERELSKLAPISATAVVAALSQANRPLALAPAPVQRARGGGEGVVGTFISAIIAGIVSALMRRLGAATRRRTTSYSRTRTRRKKTASRARTPRRKATATASVEDIFRDILGNLGK